MCAALASLISRFLVTLNEENGETCTKCLDETISATFFFHLEPENARVDHEAIVLMQRFKS